MLGLCHILYIQGVRLGWFVETLHLRYCLLVVDCIPTNAIETWWSIKNARTNITLLEYIGTVIVTKRNSFRCKPLDDPVSTSTFLLSL